MSIVLLGAGGQLGRELASRLPAVAPVWSPSRAELDLGTPLAASDAIRGARPRLVVNAAAFTDVDRAESEPALARRINGDAVGEIARACAACGSHLIHFSTDYVFAGDGSAPHREGDPVAPVNAYGESKLSGEIEALGSGCRLTILRTSWLHSPHGRNFVRTILGMAMHREELAVVDDQWGAPTSAHWLAGIVTTICRRSLDGQWQAPRTLHAVPRGSASRHEVARCAVACAIAAGMPLRAIPTSIVAVSSGSFLAPARRPLNSRLCPAALEHALADEFPSWTEGLQHTVSAIAGTGTA
ncbi:MAG: dTDP-4-dehydrorhamnose reductase [Proteobacteria bacterium]|nr:dTDP-4-dehydrorhamnose reductase [Pseudomonadota bacterium]